MILRSVRTCGSHPSRLNVLGLCRYMGGGPAQLERPQGFPQDYYRTELTSSVTFQKRLCSTESKHSSMCSELVHRTLVRASGKDATDFLQGLITNDMRLLDSAQNEQSARSMYAMMLNIQGRVLYDMILYRINENDEPPFYLLECNEEVAPEFLKLMKKYKLRKKVDLSLADEYKVFSVSPKEELSDCPLNSNLDETSSILTVRDPRVESFGFRLISRGSLESEMVPQAEIIQGTTDYDRRRYAWGVSEGTLDLPPGTSLPLESNAVFMNGVSFNKGCYIGQELTARTHHTGVIRKRLMPVTLHDDTGDISPGQKIENRAGKNCGKLRNVVESYGLALLRIGDVIGKGPLPVKTDDNDVAGHVLPTIPNWWPTDSDEIIKQALASQKE